MEETEKLHNIKYMLVDQQYSTKINYLIKIISQVIQSNQNQVDCDEKNIEVSLFQQYNSVTVIND